MQTLNSPKDIIFTDLFDIAEIQRLQDAFAQATRVASIITEPDGTPITAPSNFCHLCMDIIRQTEKGLANCMKSDAELGRPNQDGAKIQPCLSGGLWDGGASIRVGDLHVANWLIGQVRDETQNPRLMLKYADAIGADRKTFQKALNDVPTMSRDQFEKVGHVLFLLANLISKQAYQNLQLQRAMDAQQRVISDVISASSQIAASSHELGYRSEEVSNGATQQAAAAQEASASMEQMAANIKQNSENALQTQEIASLAAKGAKKVGRSVLKAVKAMKKIAKRISIIEEIAGQTRLLSLNATIEAAKVQDYGKGVAVIASEVRTLAERTKSAAEEINELVRSGVAIAKKARGKLIKLAPDIQKTAELIQEISAASVEQSTGADHINSAIQQLDLVIQKNAGMAEQIASTAIVLQTQSENLQRTVAVFKDQAESPASEPTTAVKQLPEAQTLKNTSPAANPASSARKLLDMDTPQHLPGDALDTEFERF